MRSQRADHRFHSLVPGGGATLPDPDSPQGQIQLVINHEHIFERCCFICSHKVLFQQLPDRHATQVHVGLGLGQQHFFIADARARRQGLAVPVIDHHAVLLGDAVNRKKAQIMRRELILDAGIAQPNDQLHATYFFAGAAAGSAPSSAVSCLPFLMTSGSAGAAAAASAVASGVATTSSFTDVTCATVWLSSVMNFSLPSCFSSDTRSTLPNTNSETSASRWLGMSAGRHSTSTSRSTWSMMPPSVFTPGASPTRWIGTLTRIFWSIAIRFKSMWSSLPLIGSDRYGEHTSELPSPDHLLCP